MTTYLWSAQLLTDPWDSPIDWSPGVVPGPGDIALIGYGNVELNGLAQRNIAIALQPIPHAAGVTLEATNVDFGDNTILVVGAPATPGQPVKLDVIGSGLLDDGNQVPNLTPKPGTIDFSATGSSVVNLTIELTAGPGVPAIASFTNNGVMRGDDLTITADAGTAASFFNNTAIDVTGGLTVDAGVTLDGNGVIVLDGRMAYASIAGTVGAGQTIEFVGGVQNTLTIGDIARFHGTVDITHESQIVVQGVSLSSVANNMVTFSDGSTLEVRPTGSGGNVLAQSIATFNSLDALQPATLIDATESGLPCFCAGTLIATDAGETAVEMLRAGDAVRLAGGGVARVAWVGHRDVRCDRHTRPHDVWPVRIRPGAFGPGVPRRDLWLSPDHAVAMGGALIPVRHLLNGATIVQEPAALARYHHVELARHDLLLAEGLAVESYLDTGNRAAFAESGPVLALHPDFSRRIWGMAGCAPLVESGPPLAAARRALLRQAGRLGHRRTRDPGLRVLADGRPLHTAADMGGWQVRLPADMREVRLRSRSWVPAQMRPAEDDPRRLGVAIGRLWLDGREVALDSPALAQGWHPAEPGARWTDGDAVLAVAGVRTLGFALAMTGLYWRAAGSDRLALAPAPGECEALGHRHHRGRGR